MAEEKKFRVESDLLGELKVPADALYGVQTQRGINNYHISRKTMCSYPDFIIAIGGGSSMDTAKGIGIICNNPEFSDVISLEGVADTKKKTVPIIALPTTEIGRAHV